MEITVPTPKTGVVTPTPKVSDPRNKIPKLPKMPDFDEVEKLFKKVELTGLKLKVVVAGKTVMELEAPKLT